MKRETRIPWAVLAASLMLAALFTGCQDGSVPVTVDANQVYPSGTFKFLEIDKVEGQVGGGVELGSIEFNGDANFMVSSNGEAGELISPIGNPQDWGFYEANEDGTLQFEGTKDSFEGRFNNTADLIVTPRVLGMAGSEGFGIGIKSTPKNLVVDLTPIEGGTFTPVRDMEGSWGLVGVAHSHGAEVEGASSIIGSFNLAQSQSSNTFSSMVWVGDGTIQAGSGQFEINEKGDVEFDVDGFGMDFVAIPNHSDTIFTAYSASSEQGIEHRWMAVAVKLSDEHPLPEEGNYHIYRFVEAVDGSAVAFDEGFLRFGPDGSFQVDCGDELVEGVMVVEDFEKSFMLHVDQDLWENGEPYGYAGMLDASGDVILLSTPNNARDRVTFIIGFRAR